tara:strand:+ start:159884 stop:160612 length:729 start_codon:yes stop_codon:yes gene_type:complete
MINHAARVLVVDDDKDIRTNITDILCDLGYDAVMAKDGASALQHVRQQNFEVALLDYKMPGMDGATLYEEIKKLRPSIAAIMVTAYAGSDGAKRASDAGTWDILRKPVDIRELLDKVEQATQSPLVLIVDDDESFCGALWDILNKQRYRVGIACTEAEGIQTVTELGCQIVLIDLKLGSGDGRRVIEQICEKSLPARAIIISGHPTEADDVMKQLGSHNVEAVCAKPIDIDRLLELIAKIVE